MHKQSFLNEVGDCKSQLHNINILNINIFSRLTRRSLPSGRELPVAVVQAYGPP